MKFIRTVAALAIALTTGLPTDTAQFVQTTYAQAQIGTRTFPETGHSVKGRFLDYWQKNGAVAQQGYPLTEEMDEVSATDGKTYTVQYFERAVFELHPENRQPYDVLLSLLGVFEYSKRYGVAGAPNQKPSTDSPVLFKETGKALGGKFRTYWEKNGGLAQQGYPISDEFQEKSALDGKVYTVQYFERAVFEYHPENAGTPYEVLLSQLGNFQFKSKYIYPGVAIPILPERIRFKLAGSDRYLVWGEATYPKSGGITTGTGDILGYDLKTNKPVDVSRNEPNDQMSPAVSGSIVVYQSQPNANSIGQDDIIAKEIGTGATYKLLDSFATPTGPAGRYPTVFGRTVAWIEFDNVSSRLMLQSLDSGAPALVATLPPDGKISFMNPRIGAQYLVWSEIAYWGRNEPPTTSYIKARNLKTGAVTTVAQFNQPPNGPLNEYALDGNRLFISDPYPNLQPRVIDLNTGEVTPINLGQLTNVRYMNSPFLAGEILVWSSGGVGANDYDIWGLNLKGGKVVPLVIGEGDQVSPVLAGDKLAWLNRGGPNDGGIGIVSLSAAFATAPERERALLK